MSDILNSVPRALAKYLMSNMPLEEVYEEWPDHNRRLRFPSASVITQGSGEYSPYKNAYVHAQGAVSSNVADVQYVVGTQDLTLQVDFWCRNKTERGAMYQRLLTLLHGNVENQGLRLTLEDYYGTICAYTFTGYNFVDNEESAQRQEYRVMCNFLASVNVIIEKEEYIMTEEPQAVVTVVTDPNESLEE